MKSEPLALTEEKFRVTDWPEPLEREFRNGKGELLYTIAYPVVIKGEIAEKPEQWIGKATLRGKLYSYANIEGNTLELRELEPSIRNQSKPRD